MFGDRTLRPSVCPTQRSRPDGPARGDMSVTGTVAPNALRGQTVERDRGLTALHRGPASARVLLARRPMRSQPSKTRTSPLPCPPVGPTRFGPFGGQMDAVAVRRTRRRSGGRAEPSAAPALPPRSRTGHPLAAEFRVRRGGGTTRRLGGLTRERERGREGGRREGGREGGRESETG